MSKSFADTVMARAQNDFAFRDALLKDGVDAPIAGEMDAGRAGLRDYIDATIGFQALAAATGTPPKSLMRMFGPRGNPNARNLFSVIGVLQEKAGVSLKVEAG